MAEEEGEKPRQKPVEITEEPVHIFSAWCKPGCGICVAFCPKDVLALDPITGKCILLKPEDCTKCGLCELRCPDFAITVVLNAERDKGG